MRASGVTFLVAVLAFAGSPAVGQLHPCPGGRFLVAGEALVAGDSAALHEPVVIAHRAVSIGDVCQAVAAKLTIAKRGTTVSAAWRN